MSRWSAADLLRHQQKTVERFDPFLALVQAHGLPAPQTEYRFLPDRKFRADYAWPEAMVIVEKNGGIFRGGKGGGSAQGGHSSALGIVRDMEKSNLAQLAGWTYLQFTPRQLTSGDAMPLLKEMLT